MKILKIIFFSLISLLSITILTITITLFIGVEYNNTKIKIENKNLQITLNDFKKENFKVEKIKINIENLEKIEVLVKKIKIEEQIISFKTTQTYESLKKLYETRKIETFLNDVEYKFNENIPSVKTEQVKIIVNDNKIDFYFNKKTKLGDYEIEEGRLNLTKTNLNIDFKITSIFDKKIINILNNYFLVEDIEQTKGISKMHYQILVSFEEEPTIYNIIFNTKNGEIKYKERYLIVNELKVKLDNKGLFFDFFGEDKKEKIKFHLKENIDTITKHQKGSFEIFDFGNIFDNIRCQIKKSNFSSKDNKKITIQSLKGNCIDNQNTINVSKTKVEIDFIEKSLIANGKILLNNTFDTSYEMEYNGRLSQIMGEIFINNIEGEINKILRKPNNLLEFYYEIDNKILYLPDYELEIDMNKNEYYTNDINKLSKLLKIDIFKKGQNRVEAKYLKKEKELHINSKNLNIEVLNLLKVLEETPKTKEDINIITKINLKNSTLNYKDREIKLDKLYIVIFNEKIEVYMYQNESFVKMSLYKNGKEIIEGKRISSNLLNKILKINKFKMGETNFFIKKEAKESKYKGYINQYNVLIVNSLVITNIGRLLNITPMLINPWLLIPSLPSLIKDLNLDGYLSTKSMADIEISSNLEEYKIKNIQTNNPNNNFKGYLNINSKKNTIKGSISVEYLKEYSNIIKTIPIFGSIIMGDNKYITSEFKINGTLTDPSVEQIK